MKHSEADIIREYGPFPEAGTVHGLTFDGRHVWFASGDRLNKLDPDSGKTVGAFAVQAVAGTAFDGRHFYQIAGERIQKIDARNGQVLSTIPAPEGGAAGMTWAEGSLWVGQHRARKIHQIDPETGKILRTLESNRFVTGVTWADGELWHATWENEQSEIRHIDKNNGEVKEKIDMPAGVSISGLEFDGKDRFYCGGSSTGKVRAVRKPK
jgi:glutamine cyclotransferase